MKSNSARLPVALLSLALLALAAPRLREQVQLYGQVDSLLFQGTASLNQGRIDDAERAWQTAAQLSPRNPTVQHALGALYLSSGRWPEARMALNRYADLAPTEPHALCDLAERELSTGSLNLLEPASLDAARAAILEPTCLRALTTAANAWLARGDTRRGITYLRRVAVLDPGNPSHRLRLGKLLLRAQRIAEATAVASQLVNRYPGWSAAVGLLGDCYAEAAPLSDEGRRAEPTLVRAVQLDPLNADAQAALGRLVLRRGRTPEAVKYLEAARELGATDLSIAFNLGRAYRQLGRPADAAQAEKEFTRRSRVENELGELEKRLATSPRDAGVLARLLQLSRELGDPARVARYQRLAAPGGPGGTP